MTARVGQKAPDFNAPAYHQGTFKNVQLSDHFGRWIRLCFHPGDFTFVRATEVSAVGDKYEELRGQRLEGVEAERVDPGHRPGEEGRRTR